MAGSQTIVKPAGPDLHFYLAHLCGKPRPREKIWGD
jgi:hypothetical protein